MKALVFAAIFLYSVFSFRVGAVFSLVIFTDPLTPPYEAAEWIRFACKVDSNASTFTYQWRGSCHVAGEVQFVINDPQLDKDGYAIVWVQSTPTFCLDYLECIATDKADDSTTTAGRLITNVTGIGMSLSNLDLEIVANNSALIISKGREPPNLLCHSASKGRTTGHWISPSGIQLEHPSSISEQTEDPLLLNTYSFLDLSFQDAEEEGVHSCITIDENGRDKSLYVGLYTQLNSFRLSLEYTLGSKTVLNCISDGLPATATLWNKDGILISSNTTSNEEIYSSLQTLMVASDASYNNILTIHSSSLQGIYTCDIYSDWMSTDLSDSGREWISGQFAFYTVGENVTLSCSFPDDATMVEWYQGNELFLENVNNTALFDLAITDEMNNVSYTCVGTYPSGLYFLHMKVIVLIPEDGLSVLVENKPVTPDLLGQQFNVSCTVEHVNGLSSRPNITWIGPNGTPITLLQNVHISTPLQEEHSKTVILHFIPLTEVHMGEYACKAVLISPALERPLVRTGVYKLEIEANTDTQSNGNHQKIVAIASAATALTVVIVVAILATVYIHHKHQSGHSQKRKPAHYANPVVQILQKHDQKSMPPTGCEDT